MAITYYSPWIKVHDSKHQFSVLLFYNKARLINLWYAITRFNHTSNWFIRQCEFTLPLDKTKYCTIPSIWEQILQLGFVRWAKQSGHFLMSHIKWIFPNLFCVNLVHSLLLCRCKIASHVYIFIQVSFPFIFFIDSSVSNWFSSKGLLWQFVLSRSGTINTTQWCVSLDIL